MAKRASKPTPKNCPALRKGKRPPRPYRSWYEYDFAMDMKARKIKYKYEKLKLPYKIELIYNPDWVLDNGIIIETKGVFDYDSRRKMEAVIKAHPDLDIRMIFMNAGNRLRKGSKLTYATWCDKMGIKWAEKFVPEDWISKS